MGDDDPAVVLAELEAIIAADPAAPGPEVVAAIDELRVLVRAAGASSKRARVDAADDGSPSLVPRAPDGERMHPRSAFREGNPDFGALAERHPSLRPHLVRRGASRDGAKPRWTLDFASWDATVALNAALLADAYDVRGWSIPRGYLCPAVANRANYVHWIEDLLEQSRPAALGSATRGPAIRGLDVGVGANCVYPLIGAARNGWSFVGTDVTDAALEAARRNADANPRLAPLIEIRDARIRGESGANLPRAEEGDPAPIFARVRADEDRDAERDRLDAARDAAASSSSSTTKTKKNETRGFAFTMCNPPFFESEADAKGNAGTDFGGVASEMACAGGELAFVSRILAESSASADARRFAHWYTTMCGKKETVKRLRAMLRTRGAKAVRETTFYQGKTRRWGVAWSFVATGDSAAAAKTQTQTRGGVAAPAWRATFEAQTGREDAAAFARVVRDAFDAAGCVAVREGEGRKRGWGGRACATRVAAARTSGPLRCGRGGASSGRAARRRRSTPTSWRPRRGRWWSARGAWTGRRRASPRREPSSTRSRRSGSACGGATRDAEGTSRGRLSKVYWYTKRERFE